MQFPSDCYKQYYRYRWCLCSRPGAVCVFCRIALDGDGVLICIWYYVDELFLKGPVCSILVGYFISYCERNYSYILSTHAEILQFLIWNDTQNLKNTILQFEIARRCCVIGCHRSSVLLTASTCSQYARMIVSCRWLPCLRPRPYLDAGCWILDRKIFPSP
jgi:hypothetical protein